MATRTTTTTTTGWQHQVLGAAATGALVFVSVLVSSVTGDAQHSLRDAFFSWRGKDSSKGQVALAAQAAALVLLWNALGGICLLCIQHASKSRYVAALVQFLGLPGLSSAASSSDRTTGFGFAGRLVPGLWGYERAARTVVAVASAGFGALYLRRLLSSLVELRTSSSRRGSLEGGSGDSQVDLDEVVTRADLEDLKRRLDSLEDPKNANWKLMAKKESDQLSSRQFVQHNACDPLCSPASRAMQMLVRTSFEGVQQRDVERFYYDDTFRGKWDRCFVSSQRLVGCDEVGRGEEAIDGGAGGEVVRWVRKFPAFCGLREYIIARRTFVEECQETGARTCYVVSKSVPCDLPPKLKRVNEYYSSWRVRVVPSRHEGGPPFAVETVLLHYEDVGVPNSIFRLAMKTFFGWFIQGLETNGLREYVKQRGSGQGRAKGKPASEEEETGAAHGRRWGWVRRLRPLGVVATTLVLAGKGARPRRRASTAV